MQTLFPVTEQVMIEVIDQKDTLSPLAEAFLAELKTTHYSGEIDISYATRIVTATDNSIYQALPQGILFPKTSQDIQQIFSLANQSKYQQIKFTPRGGGTGTNGQSLTHSMVIDLSRHMREILEINVEEKWVRVQTGVIKDQLNDFLRPYGFFFAPDLSTSNRATVGGMINTDASGQGSLVYGKTSDHVLGLKTMLVDGTELDTAPVDVTTAKTYAEEQSTRGKIYQQLLDTGINLRDQIKAKFPRLNRFLTGYDLENILNDELTTLDASRIITGSEGSLGVVCEAKLNITPIAEFKTLINIKYDSFDSALRNSPFLVDAKATSVETVDSRVLNLAREDIIWHSVSSLIEDVPGKDMQGLNMVEFNATNQADIDGKVNGLLTKLDSLMANNQAGIIGYQVTHSKADILKIYAMRKKAVGLLGNVKGKEKPLAFAEDTAVPPEALADFIAEFRQLLDSHNLNYGMFGHVDAGVLHVRPALDMCDPTQEKLLRHISDEVVKLTAKYGGLMWGEHGKGYRSEYGPEFFGDTLFTELRKIKTAFDPLNRLNPGKICTPLESKEQLVSVDDTKRAHFDKQIPVTIKGSFDNAMGCNGNGLCYNYDSHSPMCPSYKVTKDRRYSPKGRASLMREWMRLQSEKGIDLLESEKAIAKGDTKSWWEKRIFAKQKAKGAYDFSHEVKESMDECLACKACTTACPIKVDVPTFRARFLNLYHARYKRPFKDYLVANIESQAPLLSKIHFLVNPILKLGFVERFLKNQIGYVDSPLLSDNAIIKRVSTQFAFNLNQLKTLDESQKQQTVLIVQDPFTSFYEAELVEDFCQLLVKLGKTPVLLPFKPNGKPQHVKGFLNEFAKTAKNSAAFLNQIAQLDIPMVGLDASLVMCYRDEYNQALGQQRGDFHVLLAHEWFETQRFEHKEANSDSSFVLLNHCTETTAMPNANKVWQNLFATFGLTLNAKATGCCGMAGTYGHETQNLEKSRALYEMSWQQTVDNTPIEQLVATGFSCRSQVKRFNNGNKPKHPIQLLNSLL